ncbi:MAG: 1-hydroxycarotenoid 3,4-desaturase CrtD [Tagaea sp.]
MPVARVAVIGAGIGGLVAALALAARGLDVTIFERAAAPGGKMRLVPAGRTPIDGGPTVFTMRWVFEEIFAEAGARLADRVGLAPLDILARHAWSAEETLDLFADRERSADAIGRFAGLADARGYLDFCARARRVYQALERPFIAAGRPSPLGLTRALGFAGTRDLLAGSPFATLWDALARDFRDPRLRQLFGRYATYVGASPFACPATLMLIAHVEQEGVWRVEGGMHALAQAVLALAQSKGARIRYGAHVSEIRIERGRAAGLTLEGGERIDAGLVVCNADTAALATGRFGAGVRRAAPKPGERSLSAITWAAYARGAGFPLVRHNVFFSRDYKAEFDAIFGRSALPAEPTTYVCAQDRDDDGGAPRAAERLLFLVNAPATGDKAPPGAKEIDECNARMRQLLARCGLSVEFDPAATIATGPGEFEALFPATGGALYGPASHGWMASFKRPGAASPIPGLFLAGGSAHPGAGVPMAAMSGRLAAAAAMDSLAST